MDKRITRAAKKGRKKVRRQLEDWQENVSEKLEDWQDDVQVKMIDWQKDAQKKIGEWSKDAQIKTGEWSKVAQKKAGEWSKDAQKQTGEWQKDFSQLTGFRKKKKSRIPVLLMLAVPFLGLAWWLVRRPGKETAGSYYEPSPTYKAQTQSTGFMMQEDTLTAEPDDLTVIGGIGPKTMVLLNEAGIYTFDQLIETGPDRLREMLRDANLHGADPSTWIDQARLASQQDWAGLEATRRSMDGGEERFS